MKYYETLQTNKQKQTKNKTQSEKDLDICLLNFECFFFLNHTFFFKSLLNLLQYCFCFIMFWFFGCKAYGDRKSVV